MLTGMLQMLQWDKNDLDNIIFPIMAGFLSSDLLTVF